MKLGRSIVMAPLILIALAGCSVSAHAYLTTSASSVANQASKSLQKSVGSATAPKVDCGSGQVKLVVGTKVDCILTDPVSGSKYNTVVTIAKASGLNYSIDAQVASTPNN